MGQDLRDFNDEQLEEELKKRKAENFKEEPEEKKKVGSCAILFLFVLGVVIVIFVVSAVMGDDDKDEPKTSDDRWDALVVCQQFVEDQLKAPSLAEFSIMSDSEVENTTGKVWVVESYVDAQNSFGAMVRTHFRCEVTWKYGDIYTLGDLTSY